MTGLLRVIYYVNNVHVYHILCREQSKDEKKKPDVLEKIIQGKVNKRLSEVCLLSQNHLAEDGNPAVKKYLDTISQSLKTKVDVADFSLWALNKE